jgi:Protein of unknown function (DUF3592)
MLVSIFLLIIGGFATYMGRVTLRHRKRVYSWPSNLSKVTSKSIEKAKLSSRRGYNSVIKIEYEFTVKGLKYTGNKYYAMELIDGERPMSDKHAKETIDKIGASVPIFYNPNHPAESYVVKDHPWFMYYILIAGIIMTIIGAIKIIMAQLSAIA